MPYPNGYIFTRISKIPVWVWHITITDSNFATSKNNEIMKILLIIASSSISALLGVLCYLYFTGNDFDKCMYEVFPDNEPEKTAVTFIPSDTSSSMNLF